MSRRPPSWRSLSSATLTIASAAVFLVLVTMLSFVSEDVVRPLDRSLAWQLRGSLLPDDAPPRPVAGLARRTPS